MKLNENFLMTELGEEAILVPIGDAADNLHGIIRLNTTAKEIWQGISDGLSDGQIAEKLVEEYENIDLDGAKKVVKNLIKKFFDAGVLLD